MLHCSARPQDTIGSLLTLDFPHLDIHVWNLALVDEFASQQ